MSDRTQNARENVRIHIRIYMSDRTSEYMSDKRQRQIECQFVGITRRKFCFLPWQIPWFAAIYQSHKPLVPKTCFTISTMVLINIILNCCISVVYGDTQLRTGGRTLQSCSLFFRFHCDVRTRRWTLTLAVRCYHEKRLVLPIGPIVG